MGRIIRLPGDRHREVQLLLPWYVTGRLDPSEQALVEAHLNQCPDCMAELDVEHRLNAEITQLPMDVDQGWQTLQPRLASRATAPGRGGGLDALRAAAGRARLAWRGAPSWLGWAVAAQLVILAVAGVLTLPLAPPARYHVLGATPAAASANVIVTFRPETSEQDLRRTLNASHARLVDGPTVTDAYLLHVPAAERAAALAQLRRAPDIVLAEPVDSGGPP